MVSETLRVLEEAGWYPGRAVDTARWEAELVADGFAPLHPVARAFLAEYGGLWFPDRGAGVTRRREAFTFGATACLGEADRFSEWSAERNRDIAPIGDIEGGTCALAFLGIDEREEIYLVIDELQSFGRMPHAMDGLVLGYMARKLG